jgi:hypothetical protein
MLGAKSPQRLTRQMLLSRTVTNNLKLRVRRRPMFQRVHCAVRLLQMFSGDLGALEATHILAGYHRRFLDGGSHNIQGSTRELLHVWHCVPPIVIFFSTVALDVIRQLKPVCACHPDCQRHCQRLLHLPVACRHCINEHCRFLMLDLLGLDSATASIPIVDACLW